MEIRQVQYFLSIVETGSFSEAADEHFISTLYQSNYWPGKEGVSW
jgi:hypothetical protein